METGLSIQGVSIAKGDEILVKNIQLELTTAKCLVLIGESGSGKTLTGLSIAGLLPRHVQIQKGKVTLNGKSLNTSSAKQLQQLRGQCIAYIFQNYASTFSPQITLDKQLHETFAAHFSSSRKKQQTAISKSLEEVGLSYEQIKNKYTFQLSGGQLQRVSIAAAVMLEPQLIIADEPTTALDPQTSKQILELLNGLKVKNGCSILLTTHDLSIAREYADDIAVMYDGEIVEYGSKQELISQPKHPYTKRLIHAENVLYSNNPAQNKVRKPESDDSATELTQSKEATLIEVRHLEKKYDRETTILNDVSFAIKEGECVGLIGPSGCGKSTLARCILQLEPYHSGGIYFKNERIHERTSKSIVTGNMQTVFQHPGLALNNQLKIIDSLMEPLDIEKRSFAQKRKYHNNRLLAAEQLMEQVGLSSELLHRFPGELSGGQKQRVCIARAISTKPRFLILDEPTASLDMLVQEQIIRLLKNLQDKIGYSSLIISHDFKSLKWLSHRVLRLENGKIQKETCL